MIYVDRTSRTPYYQQIYRQLQNQIVTGELPAGALLPGIRFLANQLNVGRNTVDNAYSQLAAEGYVEAETGRGFRVQDLPALLPGKEQPVSGPVTDRRETVAYDLFYDSLSGQDFPYQLWKRELCRVLDQERRGDFNRYPDSKGDLLLRSLLSALLFQTRGVRCGADQVLITSGLQGSLEILCKLLYPSGGCHVFEEPRYDKAEFLFRCHGIRTISIPVDGSGAVAAALPEDHSVTSVYLTPSHQFPLGVVMPIGRRYEFLNWATRQDAWLIEDDYDSEFSSAAGSIPSLQSIDVNGRVIYLGSFSKTLSPSFRMGYLILPPALARRFEQTMSEYNNMVPWLLQRTLANFIDAGHYRRLVRRTRIRFHRFHRLVAEELSNAMPDVRIISQGTGLKFLLEVPGKVERDGLIQSALKEGVRVCSPARFWPNPSECPPCLVLAGFTSIEEENVADCIARLKKAWFR